MTPLKDRYGSQIHTHYPRDPRDEIAIMEQERNRFPDEDRLVAPAYMKRIIAEITAQARLSSEINQRSGVSVRVSIANFETVLSNAVRRSIVNGEEWACPRVSDLSYIVASFAGKIELETFEEGRESRVTDELTRRAVLRVFGAIFDLDELEEVITAFDLGQVALVGSDQPAAGYPEMIAAIEGMTPAVTRLTEGDRRPEVVAAAAEFILEGLHLSRRLNCDRSGDSYRYSR